MPSASARPGPAWRAHFQHGPGSRPIVAGAWDRGTPIQVQGIDAGSAAEASTPVLVQDSDAGSAAETGLPQPGSADTGSATEDGTYQPGYGTVYPGTSVRGVTPADTATGSDTGSVLPAAASADAGVFNESEIASKAAATDTAAGTDGQSPPALSGADAASAAEHESVLALVHPVTDADAASSAESESVLALVHPVTDADTATAADAAHTAWPASTDTASGSEDSQLAVLAAGDTASAQDGVHRIHVWAYIPDSLFLHGSGPLYGIRAPGGRVVAGPARLSGRLLELAHEFRAGGPLPVFVSDTDVAGAADAAVPVAALSVVALAVHFTCFADGGAGSLDPAHRQLAGAG